MIQNIAIVVLSLFSSSFLISYIKARKDLTKIKTDYVSLFLAQTKLEEYLLTLRHRSDDQDDLDASKESFIKFLSDSRTWAFDYIEDVQKNIEQIVEILKPFVDYASKKESLPYEQEIIVELYGRLKSMLP